MEKYFELNFEEYDIDDWYQIPTPNLQHIMDYQFNEERDYKEICKWFYVFIGRLLYYIGELDEWQVIGFLKGVAGTGKGTVLTKVIKGFYESDDVGILSNDGEVQFGLSAFADKLLFIAPEIKADLSLPQATFQSIVSGEDVSISQKHKTARPTLWILPGIWAGNERMGYQDNRG